jgi:hypothetical protein
MDTTDIMNLIQNDQVGELFDGIMLLLEIQEYNAPWMLMDITVIQDTVRFIGRPSNMYYSILAIEIIESRFPNFKVQLPDNVTIKDPNCVKHMVINLKYIRDMVSISFQCNMINLVKNTENHILGLYLQYKDMMGAKWATWLMEIEKMQIQMTYYPTITQDKVIRKK